MHKKDRRGLADTITWWIGSVPSIVLHTLFFLGCFAAVGYRLIALDEMLLGLTTAVSLEAIYLALFIQMTVNRASASLAEVEQDIDEIQEDVEEMQGDIDEIQEDVEELHDEDEPPGETNQEKTLQEIRAGLHRLLAEVEQLQKPH